MPCAARRCAGSASRSIFSNCTLPVAGIAPISARSSVVLPAPLRPIRPHMRPSSTLSEALRMIGIGPIETLRFSTLSMGAAFDANAADQFLHQRIVERLMRATVGDHRAIVKGQHAVGEAR